MIPSLVLLVLIYKLQMTTLDWQLEQVNWLLVIFSVFLLPVNVLVEVYKWYLVKRDFHPQSFGEVAKVVLAGRSLNVISPFGLGDVLARVSGQDKRNRLRALVALGICRTTQIIPTLLFGSVATLFLVVSGLQWQQFSSMLYLLAGVIAVVCVSLWLVWANYPSLFRSISRYVKGSSLTLSIRLTLWSFVRYAVFTLQFLLIFLALDASLDLGVLSLGVCWIFLMKSIVPGLTLLGDIANRELSAWMFFSVVGFDLELVAFASLSIWLINIVLPAVFGLFFVSSVKRNWL